MRRIYISSLYRSEDGQSSGTPLFVVDWDSKTVLTGPETPPQECLQPMRGLSRSFGTRGLAWFKDKLWVAGGVKGLSEIDPDTNSLIKTHDFSQISHPHLMQVRDGLLHVTSTGRDSLVKFDGQQVVEEIRIADMPGIPELIEPYLSEIRKDRAWGQDRVHFNSLGWDDSGNEYHTYMFCNAIFDVTRQRVLETGISAPHDIVIRGNQLFYSASGDRSLFSLDLNKNAPGRTCWIKKEIPDAELDARKEYKGTDFPFISLVRGVAITPDGRTLFTANAPGNLVCLDLEGQGRKIGEMSYCEAQGEQPFDILLDPRDW